MFVASLFDPTAIPGPIHGHYLPGPTWASKGLKPNVNLGQSRPAPPLSWSQSFSQSYRSILPTSLNYIVLSTRRCSPWRPTVVLSMTRHKNHCLPRIFKGCQEHTGHRKKCGSLPGIKPHLRTIWFFLKKKKKKRKENSFQGSRQRLRVRWNINVPVWEYLANSLSIGNPRSGALTQNYPISSYPLTHVSCYMLLSGF